MKAPDGLWFFTPEYNHLFPGVLMNLLDWLSRPVSDTEPQVSAGKPAAISGISPGMSWTGIAQDQLVMTQSTAQCAKAHKYLQKQKGLV